MSANFLPETNTIEPAKPFRFWCQKVLPLVYDDSLSYYELLCKFVSYINNCIEDIGKLADDVTAISEAYRELENYVNSYFDSLDVQTEINNKLDEMARNGSLSALIGEYVQPYIAAQGAQIEQIETYTTNTRLEMTRRLNAQDANIQNLMASVGSPLVAGVAQDMVNHDKIYVYTGDEVGYTAGNWYYWNGSTWVSGGVYQSETVATDKTLTVVNTPADAAATGTAVELLGQSTAAVRISWERYGINSETGQPNHDVSQIRANDKTLIGEGNTLKYTAASGYLFHVFWYDENGSYVSHTYNYSGTGTIVAPEKYFRAECTRSNYSTDILPDEGSNITLEIYDNTSTAAVDARFREGYILSSGIIVVDASEKSITFPSANYTRLITSFGTQIDLTELGTVYLPSSLSYIICYDLDLNTIVTVGYTDNITNRRLVKIGYFNGSRYMNLNIIGRYKINETYATGETPLWYNFMSYRYGPDAICVLGDSLSTFTGYMPDGYNAHYPTGDVLTVDAMWWHIVMRAMRLDMNYVTVNAISQTSYIDQNDASLPPAYDTTRINALGADHYPSYIFVMMGTNDPFMNHIGDMVYEPTISGLESLTNTSTRGAALTIRKLQNKYPSSRIVLLIPFTVGIPSVQQTSPQYTMKNVCDLADNLKKLADEYGVYKVIDLRKCDVNQSNISSYTHDGNIHPNADGMNRIAQYIIYELVR